VTRCRFKSACNVSLFMAGIQTREAAVIVPRFLRWSLSPCWPCWCYIGPVDSLRKCTKTMETSVVFIQQLHVSYSLRRRQHCRSVLLYDSIACISHSGAASFALYATRTCCRYHASTQHPPPSIVNLDCLLKQSSLVSVEHIHHIAQLLNRVERCVVSFVPLALFVDDEHARALVEDTHNDPV